MLPTEYLNLMGLPRRLCRFERRILDGTLSSGEVRKMAGNGLHCATVAAAFIWGAVNVDVSQDMSGTH